MGGYIAPTEAERNAATRFVAHLKIEKVVPGHVIPADRSGSGIAKRDIEEVTQLTLKASTLNALVRKLTKHIEIVDED